MFNPIGLDPGQWADAAVAAHMKYGVLTTRHHDGFALWPSASATSTSAHVPWMNGQGDVVREYVDAFRAKGLAPGLYYSVWDNTEGIGNGTITARADRLRDDADHRAADQLRADPDPGDRRLVLEDGPQRGRLPGDPRAGEVAAAQLPAHRSHAPRRSVGRRHRQLRGARRALSRRPNNTYAGDAGAEDQRQRRQRLVLGAQHRQPDERRRPSSTGTSRCWSRAGPTSSSTVRPTATGCSTPRSSRGCSEVGAAWSPNAVAAAAARAGRGRSSIRTRRSSATATSGTAANAIDGINDTGVPHHLADHGALPQSMTIDLGQTRPDVGMLGYVPRYVANSGRAPTARSPSYGDPDQHRRIDVHRGDDAAPGRPTAR